MNDQMRTSLESERELRRRLTALLFAEQVKLLEQLQDCSLVFAATSFKRPLLRQS